MFDKRLIAQCLMAKCIVAGATVALLAACNSNAPEQAGGTASGKVLPGSITDDMLPYDTATSQPPLMAPEPAAAASGTASVAQDGCAGPG